MTDGAGPGPGLKGDGSQWAKWEASDTMGEMGKTSSLTSSAGAKAGDDDSAAVRGSIPVFASGLALLFTLAVVV